MSKIECEIIKDLLPNYVEDLVSDKTKQAVDEHVKTCKPCKEDLEILQKEKVKQEQEEKEKQEEIEINHLKKYNKRLFISKIAASMLAVVILATWGIFLVANTKYKKDYKHGEYVYNLIKEAAYKLEELRMTENIEIIEERKNISYAEEKEKLIIYEDRKITQFKGNKYKEEHWTRRYDSEGKDYLTEPLNYKNYEIIEEELEKSKGIQIHSNENNEYDMSKIRQEASAFTTYGNQRNINFWRHILSPFSLLNVEQCILIEVSEEEYQGKNCYVLKLDNEEYVGYKEYFWIEKDSKLVLRHMKEYLDDRYEECIYTWNIGTVTDETIFDGYTEEEIIKLHNELLANVVGG